MVPTLGEWGYGSSKSNVRLQYGRINDFILIRFDLGPVLLFCYASHVAFCTANTMNNIIAMHFFPPYLVFGHTKIMYKYSNEGVERFFAQGTTPGEHPSFSPRTNLK